MAEVSYNGHIFFAISPSRRVSANPKMPKLPPDVAITESPDVNK